MKNDFVTVRVPRSLHAELKITGIHNQQTLEQVVEMILRTYYNSRHKD